MWYDAPLSLGLKYPSRTHGRNRVLCESKKWANGGGHRPQAKAKPSRQGLRIKGGGGSNGSKKKNI